MPVTGSKQEFIFCGPKDAADLPQSWKQSRGMAAMFKGIAHTAYKVHSLDAALTFYCDGLGFREAFRLNHPETGKLWIVYLQLGKEQFIELFPVEDDAPLAAGERYMHLCLECADLRATVEELRRRGVTIRLDVMQGLDRNLQAWIVDPDGNDIELMQIDPESPQARAGANW